MEAHLRVPLNENNKNPPCDHLEGWDRDRVREMQEGGDMGTYVYVWLIHFVIKAETNTPL